MELRYQETFRVEDNNADVAHRVQGIVQQYRPDQGWEVGHFSFKVGPQTTKLEVPLAKYDEPLDKVVDTFTVEKNRVNEKISILAQDGYSDFQTVPSGMNVVIVATRPYTRKYGSR